MSRDIHRTKHWGNVSENVQKIHKYTFLSMIVIIFSHENMLRSMLMLTPSLHAR